MATYYDTDRFQSPKYYDANGDRLCVGDLVYRVEMPSTPLEVTGLFDDYGLVALSDGTEAVDSELAIGGQIWADAYGTGILPGGRVRAYGRPGEEFVCLGATRGWQVLVCLNERTHKVEEIYANDAVSARNPHYEGVWEEGC